MTEEQIVKETFQKYSDAFAQLKPEVIVPFYYLPAILMAPGEDPIAMSTEDLVLVVFQKLISNLSKNKYQRSQLDTLNAKLLSDNTAMVSGTATRYRTDGSELGKFGYTYTLRKTNDGWKIIVGIIHDIDTALKLE